MKTKIILGIGTTAVIVGSGTAVYYEIKNKPVQVKKEVKKKRKV